jgi:hypothetical protein
MKKYELVGHVDVDAGLIQIGDPCYTSNGRNHTEDWSKFCDELFSKEERGILKVNHDLGHEGKAIVVGDFGGDGSYPVYVKRNNNGLITEIKVVFDNE